MKLHLPTEEDLKIAPMLRAAAKNVRLLAYQPYSKYLVGAAIYTAGRRVFEGCNVECADYDGTHAEEAALAAMVVGGERSPAWLAVFGGLEGCEDPSSAPPCGKCRQKLMEFSSLSGRDLRIFVDDPASGELRIALLSELLPASFGPANIGVDLAKYRR
ncbi:MAG TPA: cytidine deaminase [Candidatus Binatia bacterium]|jgi:cytidine deaminase|nr:cytidine deaminase [Candidatus Binatia bacterium]